MSMWSCVLDAHSLHIRNQEAVGNMNQHRLIMAQGSDTELLARSVYTGGKRV